MQKLFFFSGKGGVGKSTIAAAFALKSSKQGLHTLLVSVDPAHNLSDIFDKDIGGNIIEVSRHLYALEINPQKESDKYIQSVKKNFKNSVHIDLASEIERQLDLASASPGAQEAAVFDKATRLVLDEFDNYDRIIFDMAPTGHAIYLLSLPETMASWMNQMVKRRDNLNQFYAKSHGDEELPDDPIYQQLVERQQRFSKIRTIFLDQNQTGYFFVLNPERLSLLETERAVSLLKKYNINVSHLIVNRILPDDEIKTEFLIKRQKVQQQYIEDIQNIFKTKQIVYIPLLASDIYEFEGLEKIACYL